MKNGTIYGAALMGSCRRQMDNPRPPMASRPSIGECAVISDPDACFQSRSHPPCPGLDPPNLVRLYRFGVQNSSRKTGAEANLKIRDPVVVKVEVYDAVSGDADMGCGVNNLCLRQLGYRHQAHTCLTRSQCVLVEALTHRLGNFGSWARRAGRAFHEVLLRRRHIIHLLRS